MQAIDADIKADPYLRGHWGLLETAKSLKKLSKTEIPKKNRTKSKTARKTFKTDSFSHPS